MLVASKLTYTIGKISRSRTLVLACCGLAVEQLKFEPGRSGGNTAHYNTGGAEPRRRRPDGQLLRSQTTRPIKFSSLFVREQR